MQMSLRIETNSLNFQQIKKRLKALKNQFLIFAVVLNFFLIRVLSQQQSCFFFLAFRQNESVSK